MSKTGTLFDSRRLTSATLLQAARLAETYRADALSHPSSIPFAFLCSLLLLTGSFLTDLLKNKRWTSLRHGVVVMYVDGIVYMSCVHINAAHKMLVVRRSDTPAAG